MHLSHLNLDLKATRSDRVFLVWSFVGSKAILRRAVVQLKFVRENLLRKILLV
jgi:hypothetical protein